MATSGGEGGGGETKNSSIHEIPFWIFGQQKWVSGINRNTTCSEVVAVLFSQLGKSGEQEQEKLEPSSFGLVEKWRRIERPLGGTSRVLKTWQAWGQDKTEVRGTPQSHGNILVTNLQRVPQKNVFIYEGLHAPGA